MKEWHDIKFYTIPEVTTMLMTVGREKVAENDLLWEILLCFPLVLRESLTKNQKMLIGKVMEQNNPWDIVIHEEAQIRAIHGTSKPLPDPLFIQLKELFIYGITQPIELSEWVVHIKNTTDNAIKKYSGRDPMGILHLYNRIPFKKSLLKDLEADIASVIFKEPLPFKQVSITIDDERLGSLNWQIYPFFHPIGSFGQAEMLKIKDLYDLK
jgi:hypothetical protein